MIIDNTNPNFEGNRESVNEVGSFTFSGLKTSVFTANKWNVGDDHEKDLKLSDNTVYDHFTTNYDPYPSWSLNHELPISREEIEAIFSQLMEIFGFQFDSTRNMYDYLLRLLDSRASRMGPCQALQSLHADYIGGINSNFRKWYFAAQLHIDDSIGFQNVSSNRKLKNFKVKNLITPEQAETQWCINMSNLSPYDCIVQLGLYLLCWGEANIIRFMPECLCFIFKCCNDHYYSNKPEAYNENRPRSFLDHVITPLYNFYRDQSYNFSEGRYFHNGLDHSSIIGYDDMNQLFWYREGLEKIVLQDGKTKLMHIPPGDRFPHLCDIVWKKAFYKTFRETRGWAHVVTNFNRIWIIHISVFWLYSMLNLPTLYTKNYNISHDNQPTNQAKLTVLALAGGIATLISFIATILEYLFVPRQWTGGQPLFKRIIGLSTFMVLTVGPTIYLFIVYPLDVQTLSGLAIAICQFIFSIFTILYLTVKPLGKCFDNYLNKSSSKNMASRVFTADFYPLKGMGKISSYGLWMAIFASKFIESYFFLTLSLRDPIRELSVMKMENCAGEVWLDNKLCYHQATIVMVLIYLTDIVLFFLDTYLWYIVWNTLFSVFRSFYIGVSIWTPWRNIFSRLPKRIYSKLINSSGDKKLSPKFLVSQIWNSVIISMYREHLLSLEHIHKLLYKQIAAPNSETGTILKEPPFFVSYEDQSMKSALFNEPSEALRRITFFAQSLSTPMPEIGSINSMPCFSVLIPHYSEKIMLSLKEIIREEDQFSHVTMLEYLKLLHPSEWSCFVKDTKLLAEEYDSDETAADASGKDKNDIPFYSVGFKVPSPEYILRTRIWASLRTQTLYRTISGFMNYSRAIKLLFDVECPDMDNYETEDEKIEAASIMAHRKFRIVTSMQRFKAFSNEDTENTEFLLRAYPDLQISYLDEEKNLETGDITYYSSLIDGTCPYNVDGTRKPKYRIRLSGNPILGDGKSDNQNHSIIFCRGEYIQLVDANQDNYLEECLKIRSLLAEFEEVVLPFDSYSKDLKSTEYAYPVAIIGTREYIFSENFGILGDVAAGKEQTFGTLFSRTLAEIGGKLHYGHPDFLNSIFMTTRGGVSKAQKGLHLNEDIYAGMNAILRGGRIKHCEYIQCGKGRDLGFGSILNFTTKIGAGMGEQMLSREYFYLGTQLPLDRFLSFYYAHPGFHLNNVFIMLSIKLFLLTGINLAALTNESTICEYNRYRPITDPRRPTGCYNLIPVVLWLERCVFSIYVVFLISFVPLGVQELTERGFYKMFTRLGKQFASLSPLFEVFVCRIYAYSLSSDIGIGGAKYIATGRGLATIRIPFHILYTRFAAESLYFGIISGALILYCSITMWRLLLLYFWITIIALIICPFLYNPNQFSFVDFFLDYGQYIIWLHKGNSKSRACSWIGYTRLGRSKLVGLKSKRSQAGDDVKDVNNVEPSRLNLMFTDLLPNFLVILVISIGYVFSNSQNDSRGTLPVNSILRLLLVTFIPIIINIIVLIAFFFVSLVLGPLTTFFIKKFPALISASVHTIGVLNYVIIYEFLWFLQGWDFSRTLLGFIASILIQLWIYKLVSIIFISREFRHDKCNRIWWSGKWIGSGLGWRVFTQPTREFLCKIMEMSYFAGDLLIGHIILIAQFPILFIPYVDKWHSLMLFWLKPGSQLKSKLLSSKQKKARFSSAFGYFLVFCLSITCLTCILMFPVLVTKVFDIDLHNYAPEILYEYDLIQPYVTSSDRKGLSAVSKFSN